MILARPHNRSPDNWRQRENVKVSVEMFASQPGEAKPASQFRCLPSIVGTKLIASAPMVKQRSPLGAARTDSGRRRTAIPQVLGTIDKAEVGTPIIEAVAVDMVDAEVSRRCRDHAMQKDRNGFAVSVRVAPRVCGVLAHLRVPFPLIHQRQVCIIQQGDAAVPQIDLSHKNDCRTSTGKFHGFSTDRRAMFRRCSPVRFGAGIHTSRGLCYISRSWMVGDTGIEPVTPPV